MKLNIAKLEKMRKEKGLSRAAFSRYLSLESSVYGKIHEKDGAAVTVRTINTMAAALKINPLLLLK